MALVKVIGIHDKPKETIKYIVDSNKTLNSELVTGINIIANKELADKKMRYYRERYKSSDKVKTYHIIHSFSNKENITPEKAHEISIEWFKKTFPQMTIAVAATHTDTDTLHTHFVVNNVCIDGEKIRTDKAWINNAIEISNKICLEHGLNQSIIQKGNTSKNLMNKSWYEYKQEKIGNGWKQNIRADIDEIIQLSRSIEELYLLLKERGYEIRENRKYVSVKAPGKDRYVRLKTLGYNYSVEQLKNRIIGLDSYDLEKSVYKKNYTNNWIDKDIYKFTFKKGSIGTIIQITAKIVATQLGIYSQDKKYKFHNRKAEKELYVMEKALYFLKDNNITTREEVVQIYNKLEDEINKIYKYKSKMQKKIDEVNLIAKEINEINNLDKIEKEDKDKLEQLKLTMKVYDNCISKAYLNIYEHERNDR